LESCLLPVPRLRRPLFNGDLLGHFDPWQGSRLHQKLVDYGLLLSLMLQVDLRDRGDLAHQS
jgi:hypothetical protein